MDREPYDAAEIVRLLVEMNPAADESGDEDHTTFWLVLADQLQKKGIESEARARALSIIENRTNLDVLEELGMEPGDLQKRAKTLENLAQRLAQPPAPKRRRTLKAPQPMLVRPGEVYVYPVDSRANCYNPYFTNPEKANFTQAGWSSCLVVGAGHAMDYLVWYQIAPSPTQWGDRPSLTEAAASIDPGKNAVGTIPKKHLHRMQLELAGAIRPPVVSDPASERILSVVASDISASNILCRWLPEGSVPPRRRRFSLKRK